AGSFVPEAESHANPSRAAGPTPARRGALCVSETAVKERSGPAPSECLPGPDHLTIESPGIFQVLLVRVTFGDSPNHLEGPEGVKSLAGNLSQNGAVLLPGHFCHGLGAGALGSAVGVEEKYRLAIGQILPGKLHHRFLEFKAVNAGS